MAIDSQNQNSANGKATDNDPIYPPIIHNHHSMGLLGRVADLNKRKREEIL